MISDISDEGLKKAKKSIWKVSESQEGIEIHGYDFDEGFNFEKLMNSYKSTGFQASHLAKAIEICKKIKESKEKEGTTIFLAYTSNIISSGLRDIIRYLVQKKAVDVIVTTAGGFEEDIIKCLKPFVLGDWRADGTALREAGINRTGNIFVPNDRYIEFEKFANPILQEMLKEQKEKGKVHSPSEIIKIFGERINNTDSIYYWAAKHNIPVFCPAITDGSFGDISFFFKHRGNEERELKIDIADDNFRLNNIAIEAKKTAAIILGSGIVKHIVLNANMMREGTDYAVYINTAPEYDGSDSGALPEEAKSWGKISADANHVKVFADATIAFPLIVASVWNKTHKSSKS